MPKPPVGNGFALLGGSMGYKTLRDLGSKLKPIGVVDTPFGQSNPAHIFEDTGLIFMSRHGETGYNRTASFVNYRANIWALKELGTERIIAWSGPAAIDESLKIGEIVAPGDLIDETRRRDYTFFEDLGIGFIRQSPTFCPALSTALANVCSSRFGKCITDSVYVCTEGPRLETAAEIRKFAAYGGHLVGMTLVPEVFLAKELEMCYAPLCYVTNYAEGVRPREFRPGVLFEGLLDDSEAKAVDAAVQRIPELALAAVEFSLANPGECSCRRSMERYRKRGDIGDDWRTWINRPDS